MNNKKNILTAILQQVVSIVSAFILPRLIIGTFGSEVNGLVSSITQFLSFIALLEGGLGAVVLAELYRPLEQKDEDRVRDILNACSSFFEKLTLLFIAYTALVSLVFPFMHRESFSFAYVCSLVWILSASTLIHYLFSITNKLLLQAQQKVYIVNLATTAVIAVNLLLSVIVLRLFPDIHFVKLISGLVYLIQPAIYKHYVEKKFRVPLFKSKGNTAILKNRWDGFAQNLAHFINMNTDIAVLTVFVGLSEVSVYSVYMLVINGLLSMFSIVSNSYQSTLGKYYAQNNTELLRTKFFEYSDANWCVCLIVFNTCLLLINPFVGLYTKGVEDANYFQPLFALIIIGANMLYCIREPFRFLVLSAGKFRETNRGAILEAVINLSLSILLARSFGLAGVAVGTFAAILYRFVYFLFFLRKNIIFTGLRRYIPDLLITLLAAAGNVGLYFLHDFSINTPLEFIITGSAVFAAETLVIGSPFVLPKLLKKKRRSP